MLARYTLKLCSLNQDEQNEILQPYINTNLKYRDDWYILDLYVKNPTPLKIVSEQKYLFSM